jgi:hypothetical protein
MRLRSKTERGRTSGARRTSLARVASVAARGVSVVAALLAAACIRLPLQEGYAGPAPLPVALAEEFAYPPATSLLPASDTVVDTRAGYRVRRIELESTVNVVESHTIVLDYYEVESDEGPVPVVLVLPVMGGRDRLARHFASVFARRGMAAVIVNRQEGDKDTHDLDRLNAVFRQIVLDHRQALDWIERQPELAGGRTGLFGISAGGVKGGLIYPLDPRIDAAVLALAGGDLPHILTHSTEGNIARSRRRVLREQGIGHAQFHAALREGFRYDPLAYAPYADARNVLLVLACFDRVVPYASGLALRRALGGPETVIIPTGHYGAMLYLPYLESAAVSFLEKRLRPD